MQTSCRSERGKHDAEPGCAPAKWMDRTAVKERAMDRLSEQKPMSLHKRGGVYLVRISIQRRTHPGKHAQPATSRYSEWATNGCALLRTSEQSTTVARRLPALWQFH
jgi:hypothetical protein